MCASRSLRVAETGQKRIRESSYGSSSSRENGQCFSGMLEKCGWTCGFGVSVYEMCVLHALCSAQRERQRKRVLSV